MKKTEQNRFLIKFVVEATTRRKNIFTRDEKKHSAFDVAFLFNLSENNKDCVQLCVFVNEFASSHF